MRLFTVISACLFWWSSAAAAGSASGADELKIGVAATDLTPPVGFPMAGYYHERLAEGTIDPLHAKAMVFRSGAAAAALVVCDLIGISTDLSREIRRRASEHTGIPMSHIVVAATHSHTAPDYGKELWVGQSLPRPASPPCVVAQSVAECGSSFAQQSPFGSGPPHYLIDLKTIVRCRFVRAGI